MNKSKSIFLILSVILVVILVIRISSIDRIDNKCQENHINKDNTTAIAIVFPDSELEAKNGTSVFVPGFKLYTNVHKFAKNWHEYHRNIYELLYEQNRMRKIIKQECIDDKLIQMMNLKSGNWIADVGAGQGSYTQEFRRIVGKNGKVYTTDIDPNSKEYIDWYAKCIENGTFAKLGFRDCYQILPDNLVTQVNSYEDPNLPMNKFDWVFMNMVHIWANVEFTEDMKVFADNLKKSMKNDGKILLTEIIYSKIETPERHRIHLSTIGGYKQRFEQLGFNVKYIEIDNLNSRLIAILTKNKP